MERSGVPIQHHHEAYNMLQRNGLGLVHHLNGTQSPQVNINGSSNTQATENYRTNGNSAQSQFLNTSNTLNNTSSGVGNSSGCFLPNDDTAVGKLFVGGLSWQTTPETLREYFGMFGAVSDVLIVKDPLTQRSRGFGFITFSDSESVEKVLKVPIHTLDGKKIDVKHATPKNKPKQLNRTKKIFVGGVNQDTSTEEVKAYFSQFGKVEDGVLLMDQVTKRHRGFGFITFENEDIVDRVCEIHFHTIKNKKVECKKAQPKETQYNHSLLSKRMVVMGGVRMATPTPVTTTDQLVAQAHVQAAAAAAAAAQAAAAQNAAAQNAAAVVQNAAAASYGKLITSHPSLAGYRYAPYTVAALPQTAPPPPPAAHPATPALATAAALAPAPTPYPAYSLANVDMSSFQGVDWSSMYGMYD